MARKPRTHDLAIDRLRKQAREHVKEAADESGVSWLLEGRESLMLKAAAFDIAADFLNGIQGKVERKPKAKAR